MEPHLEVVGHCAVLWLGDGENRFTTSYLERINRLLDAVLEHEKFSECTTLITTGAGRFYSNGIDLDWLRQVEKPDDSARFLQLLGTILGRLLTFPLLTIAALNGHAFAGGALLALVHDARIMRQQGGWLCLPEVFLRIPFRPAMLALIRCKVPPSAVLEFVTLGHRLPGEKALELQLIEAVVPKASSVVDEAVKMSRTLLFMDNPRMLNGQYSREAIAMMKEGIYQDIAEAFHADKGGDLLTNQRVSSKL